MASDPVSNTTIVNVKLALAPKPEVPSIAHYAILCDRTSDEMEAFADAHEDQRCFVFPFFTLSVNEMPNCSELTHPRVVMPYYVGNLFPVAKVIRQIVAQYCAHPEWASPEWAPVEWVCIHDETPKGESDD